MPDKTGIMVATALGGGLLLWSGINNKGVLTTARDLLQGNRPAPGPAQSFNVNLGSLGGGSAGPAPGSSPSGVVNDALKYNGNRYVWGGVPGTTVGVNNGTDCSGFVNMVVGRDLGQPIPGYGAGQYRGASHGPPTGAWLIWGGVRGLSRDQLQPGDLIVWQTHMGIYIGNGQMISALDTKDGVKVTTLNGGSPTGEVPFYKRLTGLSGIAPTPSGNPPPLTGGIPIP